jgi:hypothetical protein
MHNLKRVAFILFVSGILFERITLSQIDGTPVRGKNPMRIEWEDASKRHQAYKNEINKSLDTLSKETHELFHGQFDRSFSQLAPEKKAELIKRFNLLLDENGLRTIVTFSDVFQIPSEVDLLFPLHFGQREPYSLSFLESLTLRSKKGHEKGKIKEYRVEQPNPRSPGYQKHFYMVTTATGDIKEERLVTLHSLATGSPTGSDDMTVFWSEISQRPWTSILSIVQHKSLRGLGVGRPKSDALAPRSSTGESSVTDDTVVVKLGDYHTFQLDGVAIAVQLVSKPPEDYLWNKYQLNVEIENASHNLVIFDSSKTYLVDDQGLALHSRSQDFERFLERAEKNIRETDNLLSEVDRLFGRRTMAEMRHTRRAIENIDQKLVMTKPREVPPGGKIKYSEEFHTFLNPNYLVLSLLGVQAQSKSVNVVARVMEPSAR